MIHNAKLLSALSVTALHQCTNFLRYVSVTHRAATGRFSTTLQTQVLTTRRVKGTKQEMTSINVIKQRASGKSETRPKYSCNPVDWNVEPAYTF